jgi:hypothetical protein
MSEREQITIGGASGGWNRVQVPSGETRYVSEVYIAGIAVEQDLTGGVTLTVQSDRWSIDDAHEPGLYIEVPEWYAPEPDREGATH